MTIKSADGIEGCLIKTGDGGFMFRVYHGLPGDFTDYDIWHNGMVVVIKDPDSCFRKCGEKDVLDHLPETLGESTDDF